MAEKYSQNFDLLARELKEGSLSIQLLKCWSNAANAAEARDLLQQLLASRVKELQSEIERDKD